MFDNFNSPQILSNITIRYCSDLISKTSSRNSYPFVWSWISDRSVRRSLFRRKYNVLCKSGAVCRSRDKTANRVSRVVQATIFISGTLNNSSVTFMNFIDAGILFSIGAGFLDWQLSDRDRVWICLSSFILSTILYFHVSSSVSSLPASGIYGVTFCWSDNIQKTIGKLLISSTRKSKHLITYKWNQNILLFFVFAKKKVSIRVFKLITVIPFSIISWIPL